MTNQSWPSEEQQQWTQPPFATAPASPSATGSDPYRGAADPYQQPQAGQASWNPPDAVSGAVLVPGQPPYRAAVSQRSPAEQTVRTVARLIWPVMIVLAIFGYLPWFPAIVIAIVAGSALEGVAHDQKRRRINRTQQTRRPPEDDLR
ncbi:MAG: hypothetical protein VB080_15895 [Propionicimonas sp.]|uniref:hypothetical protein n=1 Tax=Propionicimonas sp. TaxID=1955623 RepID=UPI002B211F81|nr:hypothetical protein [Propionicimonas sp.]MEA4945903.1 hypothetical protein [Propionicimonas sp.]MEA5054832.1 hypothetical protein [Propionicimonas sp.]MEA5118264.1 hypothetical protein [Propionicimonas sp.]